MPEEEEFLEFLEKARTSFSKVLLTRALWKSTFVQDANEFLRLVEMIRRLGKEVLGFSDEELYNFLQEDTKNYNPKSAFDSEMQKAISTWHFVVKKFKEREPKLGYGLVPPRKIGEMVFDTFYKKVKQDGKSE